MRISLSALRKVLREEIERDRSEFVKVLNRYIRDSRTMNPTDRRYLAGEVAMSRLRPGLVLERVSPKIPGEVGDTIHYDLASFTKVRVSRGKNAGNIGWKYTDKCILRIENPKRGLEVDYDVVDQMFDASEEQEVLLSGDYRIASKEMITEPGTLPQYDYKVPVFILEEI